MGKDDTVGTRKVPNKSEPYSGAKRDHYVPAVYLKRFGSHPHSKRGGTISVMPLEVGYMATEKSINEVCFEWDRNTSKHPDDARWLENFYGLYETEVGKVLPKIANSSELMEELDIIILAEFIAIQFFRSKAWDGVLESAIDSHGILLSRQYPNDPVSQTGSLRLFSASGLAHKLIHSHWIFIAQGDNGDLLTSDSPVVPLWDKDSDMLFPNTVFFNVNRKLSVIITEIGLMPYTNNLLKDRDSYLVEPLSVIPLLNHEASMSIGHVSQKRRQTEIITASNQSAFYRFQAMMMICNEIDQAGLLKTRLVESLKQTMRGHKAVEVLADVELPQGQMTLTPLF